MQDILSLVDKKEEKSKQAITKLENYYGQYLQIHIANYAKSKRTSLPQCLHLNCV